MHTSKKLGLYAAALACINLLVPLPLLQAADSSAQASAAEFTVIPATTSRITTHDFTLGPTGELRGQVVDKNGVHVADRIVVAVHSDKSSLETVTDANGRFRFVGAKPGMYQVASERGYQSCRCWAAATAPPSATTNVLLVEGDQTLRGQRPIGEILSGPVLIGLLIAAAIIIPIAVHNSRKSAS